MIGHITATHQVRRPIGDWSRSRVSGGWENTTTRCAATPARDLLKAPGVSPQTRQPPNVRSCRDPRGWTTCVIPAACGRGHDEWNGTGLDPVRVSVQPGVDSRIHPRSTRAPTTPRRNV
jgi:hypothetical protein